MTDSSNSLKKQLQAAFGTDDIYQIFGVVRTATTSEIKKAYMKLALVHHPDKGGDKEKFQALSLAHSILSDEEKRKIYDEHGCLDDDAEVNEENFEFWYQYFRNLFPKISLDDISRFGQEYVGSEEERNDVLQAYNQHRGRLQHIMDSVMFAEEGEELRIIALIDSLIESGELTVTKAYTKDKAKAQADANDTKKTNQRKRKQATKAAQSEEALSALIKAQQQNRQRQAGALASILSKYENDDLDDNGGRKTKRAKKTAAHEANDIDEDEFQRIQQSLQSKSASKQSKRK